MSLDNGFVAWFCEAYVLGSRKSAVDVLVGGAGDLGVDSIYVEGESIHLVQGKYHRSPSNDNKGVRKFHDFAVEFMSAEIPKRWQRVKEDVKYKLLIAHRLAHTESYRVRMYFVTTDRVRVDVARNARRELKRLDATNSKF